MARPPSHIMTLVEKKVQTENLKKALATSQAPLVAARNVKAEAAKSLAAAKKTAAKALKDAQAVLDAAEKKEAKAAAAAAKGRAKITGQLEVLKAAPTKK